MVSAQNLVTNPGFENPNLTTFFDVLGPPYELGAWGPENSSISTATNGVSPFTGTRMLCMNDDNLTVTQVAQRVDISHLATKIDAGLVWVNLKVRFNVPSNVNAASANARVHFLPDDSEFDQINLFDDVLSFVHTNGVLDSDPQTWQKIKIEAPVPPGTRSLLVEFSYGNASLGGNPGYVDAVKLSLKMKKLPKCHGIPITSGCRVDGVGPTLCLGNDKSNVIIGTSQADVIVGGKQNDVIRQYLRQKGCEARRLNSV